MVATSAGGRAGGTALATHLAGFRGESASWTWVWRVGAYHLLRFRRGRRETLAFDLLGERLGTGLRFAQAMFLCLDRNSRIAWVLGDIFGLSSQEAATVLATEPATFRKRLSRARARLYAFMRGQCGVYDPRNPRFERQVECPLQRGLLRPDETLLARHPARAPAAALPIDPVTLEEGAEEVAACCGWPR